MKTMMTVAERKAARTLADFRHRCKRVGITVEDYERILADQGGVCGICLEPRREYERLNIDHDHDTGRVRGLLCRRCNSIIVSFFERDNGRLPRLIEWLKP